MKQRSETWLKQTADGFLNQLDKVTSMNKNHYPLTVFFKYLYHLWINIQLEINSYDIVTTNFVKTVDQFF